MRRRKHIPPPPPTVLQPGYVIDEQYEVVRQLGAGACGDVYLAVSLTDPKEEVAVKVENMLAPKGLFYERDTLQVLDRRSGGQGRFPRPKSYSQDFDLKVNMMIMDKLGPSLENRLEMCGGKFSMKTVLMLANQMLECLQFVHNLGYIHRDIKPENFVMGEGPNRNRVFIIDFGFSTTYRGGQIRHIKCTNSEQSVGTPLYASLQNHRGCTLSRRDDLEALGYVLIYFLRGSLPWQGVNIKGNSRNNLWTRILESKQATSVEDLCQGFPQEFSKYINYCRNLGFDEDPLYFYLRKGLFWKLFNKLGCERDGKFDWDAKNVD
ncbi:unnamed protein product [Orchesella dallaii]|uniref:non-specific serine/threonine protein kinase n=1 Tax=Orchesella dallaii TaxID=48710 RepID=A0ABP1RKQ9_9HEXA